MLHLVWVARTCCGAVIVSTACCHAEIAFEMYDFAKFAPSTPPLALPASRATCPGQLCICFMQQSDLGLVTPCRTAVTVANQQQDSEVTALRAVISLANETLFDLINATIAANYTSQLSALDSAYSSDPNNVCPQAHLSSWALLSTPAAAAILPVAVLSVCPREIIT